MSSRLKENPSSVQLLNECLAVNLVPKKLANGHTKPNGYGPGKRGTPAISDGTLVDDSLDPETEESPIMDCGLTLFTEFIRENQQCFWNQCLVQTMSNLDFAGQIGQDTVLLAGSPYSLEVVRSAWARRVLRPPAGYDIQFLGEVSLVEMSVVPQTQFAPLSEALCKAVLELNTERRTADLETIASSLQSSFPAMIVPNHDLLYRTLGSLIKERKVYHTGKGYFVVAPSTFRSKTESKTSCGFKTHRQMLMTNEEAIGRLHSIQDGSPSRFRRRDSVASSGTVNGTLGKGRSRCTQADPEDILNARQWGTTDKVIFPSPEVLRGCNSSESLMALVPRRMQVAGEAGRLERSHSLKLLGRNKEKDKLNRSNSFKQATSKSNLSSTEWSKSDSEGTKREKRSMFSRLFRRSQSREEKHRRKEQANGKRSTFTAQFPPPEWSDTDSFHLHSQGTQTALSSPDRPLLYTPPRVHMRSSSVGRASSQERHSFHVQSTLERHQHLLPSHRCESDGAGTPLRLKSSSLPRRSYPSALTVDSMDSNGESIHTRSRQNTNGGRGPSTPTPSKRSSRHSISSTVSSPRRHSTERHTSLKSSPCHSNKERLNNGLMPSADSNRTNNKLSGVPVPKDLHYNIRNNKHQQTKLPCPPQEINTTTAVSNEWEQNQTRRHLQHNYQSETEAKSKMDPMPVNNWTQQKQINSTKKAELTDSESPTPSPVPEPSPKRMSSSSSSSPALQHTKLKEKTESDKEELTKTKVTDRMNGSIDLEVNLTSKTNQSSPVKKISDQLGPDNLKANNKGSPTKTTTTTSRNHSISIKTGTRGGGNSNRPLSITTVTSITTSLSQGALKDGTKSSVLENEPIKSKSTDNSPVYANNKQLNDKLAFLAPVKRNKCDLIKNEDDSSFHTIGTDDSGFLSVSPV